MKTAHSIVELPIAEGAIGAALPVLILADGEVSIYALAWARKLALDDTLGPVGVAMAIKAVGLLYDYYTLVEKGRDLTNTDLPRLLAKFLEARQHGKVLGWKPVQRKTAVKDVMYASTFLEFSSDNFGQVPANPRERLLVSNLSIPEQQRFFAQMSHRKYWDKLAHLTPATEAGKGKVTRRVFNPSAGKVPKGRKPKYFPPSKVLPLFHETRLVRDLLYFLLLFFGGLRESEPLHLFVTDIRLNKKDGTAEVKLAHPEFAPYEWGDEFRGKQNGTREAFLKDHYGLGPRNKLGSKDPMRSGWKGICFDSGYEATVNWLIPDMGRLFWKLHVKYMQQTRAHVKDTHPYYFVNTTDGHFGTPAKLSNMIGAFERAAIRVGLNLTEDGVNPHGARHFYGFYCASYLGLTLAQTQTLMHHANVASTQIYFDMDDEVAREHLRRANEKLSAELPIYADAQKLLLSKF